MLRGAIVIRKSYLAPKNKSLFSTIYFDLIELCGVEEDVWSEEVEVEADRIQVVQLSQAGQGLAAGLLTLEDINYKM